MSGAYDPQGGKEHEIYTTHIFMNNILTNGFDNYFITLLKNNNDDYIQLLTVNHYDLPCQIIMTASMATLVL